ncbi:hypothetical protein ACHHYP_15341 [Achlya hypogyna]|uniref:Uncharacterized protein n=1 Tax=Achlya hypogyna TaxID=1202772 RepID=A0A1V9YAZ6_ACHHY|nr:hypothetical protein ACHHYP_15341 [Achlya hypogyna]
MASSIGEVDVAVYVAQLESLVLELVQAQEADSAICRASAECTFAKNTAGRVLTALFDHATGGKADGLKAWWKSGSIQTRNGPAHWRLDPRGLRDKRGFNLLHAAVDRSLAKENLKVATVEVLVDVLGLDPSGVDLFGRTALHYAALNGYADVVDALLARGANPHARDKAGLTPLATLQQTTLAPNSPLDRIVRSLVAFAEKPQVSDNLALSPPRALPAAVMAVERLRPFVAEPAAFAERVDVWRQSLELELVRWHEIVIPLLGLDADDVFLPTALASAAFRAVWEVQVLMQRGAATAWATFCARMARRCQDAQQVPAPPREPWHYAALLVAAARSLPPLAVVKGSATATTPTPALYPQHERLLLGATHYWVVAADAASVTLDRPFEGPSSDACAVYVAADAAAPPRVQCITLHERVPGNPFETNSSEEDLVQDYQLLDPEAPWELRLRVGPAASRAEARAVAAAWRARARELFALRSCPSGTMVCAHACPQKKGEHLCPDGLEALGKEFATAHFGRATFAKAVPVRASVQKHKP